jgi:hypothetical protein
MVSMKRVLKSLIGLVLSFSCIGLSFAKDDGKKKQNYGQLELTVSGKACFDCFLFPKQKALGTYLGSSGNPADPGRTPEASTVFEETPSGELSAVSSFYVYEKNKDASNMFAFDNSGLYFDVLGKKDEYTSYGMTIVLTGDAGSAKSVRQAFLMFRNYWGTIFLGNTSGVENFMSFNAGSIQAGTGGIFGNFLQVFSPTTGTNVRPGTVGNTGFATKAVYVTPRVKGIQCGISYTPNNQHTGEGRLNTAQSSYLDTKMPYDRDSIGVGVNYAEIFGDFGLSLSGIGLFGQTQAELWGRPYLERFPTRTFAFGTNIFLGKFEFGGEYLFNGMNQTWKRDIGFVQPIVQGVALPAKAYRTSEVGNSWAFDLGAAYTFGDTKFSCGYFYSARKNGFVFADGTGNTTAKGRIVTVSVEHKIVEGFMPYVECAFFKTENPDAFYLGVRQLAGARGLGGNSSQPLNKSYPIPIVTNNEVKGLFIVGTKVSF